MQIDIFSDTVCPWCLIGKRRLARALAERPDLQPAIRWRSFQLNPEMPDEGLDRQRYLEIKFGSPEAAREVYAPILKAGSDEGIAFDFAGIRRTPNTLQSHRLIRIAGEQGRQDAVVDAVFGAYFMHGQDIGDIDVLVSAAAEAGLEAEFARAFLESDAEADAVRAEDLAARRAGIQGVPCFIFNGRYALSGAQPPEVLLPMFDLAIQDDHEQGASATG